MIEHRYGDIVKGRFGRPWIMMYLGLKAPGIGYFLVLVDEDAYHPWASGQVIDGPIALLEKNTEWLTPYPVAP